MLNLENLSFASPLILYALFLLPLIYWLIRFFPPTPKKIKFPAFRLIADLKSETNVAKKTPPWLLILRLLIVSLIILAFANPIANPQYYGLATQVTRIVIQNDWAAGQNWQKMMHTAENIIFEGENDNRQFIIEKTNHAVNEQFNTSQEPLNASEAKQLLSAIKPHPWQAETEQLLSQVQNNNFRRAIETYWIGSGAITENSDLFKAYTTDGGLIFFEPTKTELPSYLSYDPVTKQYEVQNPPQKIEILARNGKSETINRTEIDQNLFSPSIFPDDDIQSIAIHNQNHAGAVWLLNKGQNKARVVILQTQEKQSVISLSNPSFYIENALSNHRPLQQITFDALEEDSFDILFLPDTKLSNLQQDTLLKWIEDGHILVRFAGNFMSEQAQDQITAVPLRYGLRSFDGVLTLEERPQIAPIKETSPLYGLTPPQDLIINTQILADPAFDLNAHQWLSLTDGTPIVTAKEFGKGLLIFVHVTAGADWSDLPLSGFYMNMLERFTNFASKLNNGAGIGSLTEDLTLFPKETLNGFGYLNHNDNALNLYDSIISGQFKASAKTPPGYYADSNEITYAQNLGTSLTPNAIGAQPLPANTQKENYTHQKSTALKPYLLLIALALFALDSFFALFRQNIKRLMPAALLTFCLMPTFSFAEPLSTKSYADALYLPYVQTGIASIDNRTKAGLDKLVSILKTRTNAEPKMATPVNLHEDQLHYFPLLYWPIDDRVQTYTEDPKVTKKVQEYLSHGGTILFDILDPNYAFSGASPYLKQLTQNLQIPVLDHAPKDHVLRKSFYLLRHFSGAKPGKIWLETYPLPGRDNVSSVIISTIDLAGGWGLPANTRERRKQEMAWRLGINIVMYVLTGNYKADQVHLPHILKRLGQ